ncbi:MBL fold metallo-hydrolase RNA specificity domain-containing protein [Bradyrhizobium sp. WSM2793]|uniref:MBL fold metallo-hydrolase RNA specificity domain-containing protein n=1 Tax=Bradyrhizobium sp. WSM2793 TaxID=1038866 RepID=UPI00036681D6|nr:MBL fold metallo-hydrolase [Bradyrhizobium sp. WSM2793]
MAIHLSFLGAAGTVTGSKYLVENEGSTILVDCGLFQGFKELRLRNWAPLPFNPHRIETVVLTHAHLDHSGALPLLTKRDFPGHVFCSRATADLCGLLLPDSGHLQEKDAEFANRHGFSKHKPALPLYTEQDARNALKILRPLPFDQDNSLSGGATIHLRRAGHILGAASVQVEWAGRRIVFSGDLGRYDDATMVDPVEIDRADYLVVESTYGNRRHPKLEPEQALLDAIGNTTHRGGTVIIPAFAVGRTQSLLYYLERLKESGRLINVPVFLDSPMAQDASEIFCRDVADHRLPPAVCRRACAVAHYVRSVDESKALMENPMPKVIISASGMATGGRVLHHLKRYAPDPKNTILFAGFQAGGTRGAAMVAGADSIKIHGNYIPVRAEVRNLDMLSGHADAGEILRWLRGFKTPPKTTFITHGEPAASDALRVRITEELGWRCVVPEHGQKVELE